MVIAVAILSAVFGIVIGFLGARVKSTQQVYAVNQAGVELEKQIAVLQSQLESATRKIAEVKAEADRRLAETKADDAKMLAAERESAAKLLESTKQEMERRYQNALNEQKVHFDNLSKRLVAEAKNATEEMVQRREKQITESGHATMEQLVNPLKETIAKMEKTMNETTLQQTNANSALKEVLKQSIESNAATKQSAEDLVRAFKHDSKIQGDWGECVLEELLQALGLEEGVHFETQATLRDASGNTVRSDATGCLMRPDVIVHLDKTKDVIVDSKVSMKDFLDYVSAEDPDLRKDLLKKHIESLKKHVKELSAKDYSRYVKAPKKTMDFVIMFVPRSAALWVALNKEPALWREAMEKNVFIADEQTLYAALRMIKLSWCQIQQADNQQKVFELANEMLNRVGQFVKQMRVIGDSLEKAQKAYKSGMSKFAEKGQSVLTTCRKLELLGAKQDANCPLPTEQEAIEYQEIETVS
ncbi:DNA recombination protein RmuC [Fibrobacter sp.]|uniref:DNA recombination protein RmuC n=1 Tax=Fibrobacter sp. TaxID=35828 RepID=UPI0025C29F92|nr:DNA recombination protein RmuC [Fibrobacter sp.]MBR3071018.1 DNA recombination protein RmuC [Fibrobacter sp.]